MFFGLGSDGTVGANKNTIKILGDAANLHAQGYFVYDSKKSGSQTVSHLRFGPRSIHAPYLVSTASFVGCHKFGMIERDEVLDRAARGATLLLNCPHEPDQVWDALLARRAGEAPRQGDRAVRDRRREDRAGGGTGGADEHRAADVLLRDLRRDGARAGDRGDQGVDSEDVREAGRGGGQAQRRGGRPLARGAAPGAGPRSGHLDARGAGARAGGRARVRPDA